MIEPIKVSPKMSYSELRASVVALVARANLITKLRVVQTQSGGVAKFNFSEQMATLDLPEASQVVEALVVAEDEAERTQLLSELEAAAAEKELILEAFALTEAETTASPVTVKTCVDIDQPASGVIDTLVYSQDGKNVTVNINVSGSTLTHTVVSSNTVEQITYDIEGFWGTYSSISVTQLGGTVGVPQTFEIPVRIGYFDGATFMAPEFYTVTWLYLGGDEGGQICTSNVISNGGTATAVVRSDDSSDVITTTIRGVSETGTSGTITTYGGTAYTFTYSAPYASGGDAATRDLTLSWVAPTV